MDLQTDSRIADLARAFFTPRRPREVRALELPDARRRHFQTRHGRIAATESGQGREPVLLVHGWEGQAADMQELAAAFVHQGHRVLVVDLPAHGESEGQVDGRMTSIPWSAQALLDVQQAVGPTAAVVAHSVGAAVAVEALGLGLVTRAAVLLAAPAHYVDYAHAFAAKAGLADAARDDFVQAIEALGVNLRAIAMPATAARLQQRALFVHAHDDSVVPMRDAETSCAAWLGARLLRVQGLGHRGVLTDAAVRAEVLGFVGAASGQPAAAAAASARTARTRELTLDGQRIAWRELGHADDRPPLLMLQRLRGTMDHWDPDWLDLLARGRRVLVFDSPGVGRSHGEVPPTIAGMADAAARFATALGHERVDVLGWSMGGMVAQQLALAHPALVRRVIVAGSTPGPVPGVPRAPERVWQVASKPVNDDEDFLYLFWTDAPASVAIARAHMAQLHTRTEAFSPPVSATAWQRQIGAIMAWAGGQDAAWPRLAALRQPVLVANGLHDRMVSAQASYAMAAALPDAKLVLYPDAGHAFLFRHPADFAAQVAAFLDAPRAEH